MVSEIQTEDDEMMEQLLKQGFLPLNTPVEKLGETSLSLEYRVNFELMRFKSRGQLCVLLNCL